MAKTYEELMAMAESTLERFDERNGEYASALMLYAQTCVVLAKERRDKRPPINEEAGEEV